MVRNCPELANRGRPITLPICRLGVFERWVKNKRPFHDEARYATIGTTEQHVLGEAKSYTNTWIVRSIDR